MNVAEICKKRRYDGPTPCEFPTCYCVTGTLRSSDGSIIDFDEGRVVVMHRGKRLGPNNTVMDLAIGTALVVVSALLIVVGYAIMVSKMKGLQ